MLKKKYYTVIPRKPLRKKFGGGGIYSVRDTVPKVSVICAGWQENKELLHQMSTDMVDFFRKKIKEPNLYSCPGKSSHLCLRVSKKNSSEEAA